MSDTASEDDEGADDPSRRRQSERADIVLQLEYRNAGHLLVSYCTNLSRGGLFIPTAEPQPAGTRLTLRLDVPGKDEPVSIDAEVRWVRAFNTDEGPAGMGLAFASVDSVLGDQIDGIVARFAPLQVELVGDRPAAWTHVAAQLRSLVTCETRERTLDDDGGEPLDGADLVIVDLDSAPTRGLELLRELSALSRPPPRVGLCAAQDMSLAGRAARHARVVRTPVDGSELRSAVLECVSRVHAHRQTDPSVGPADATGGDDTGGDDAGDDTDAAADDDDAEAPDGTGRDAD
ncbi:MAG: TIGR02266 family protein [Myxococcota bacterium]